MDTVKQIESEVQSIADGMGIEILIMLLDKMERDFDA
jgi:hypothetical protein